MIGAVEYDRGNDEVLGWLYAEDDPRAVQTAVASVGGVRVATLTADRPSMGRAGPSLDASFNAFEFRLPSSATRGDRITSVEVATVDGQPLTGSPFMVEGRLPIPEFAPQFRLADRSPSVVVAPAGFSPSGDQIVFEAAEPFVTPKGEMTGNAPWVGGLWGHRAYPPWRAYMARLTDVFVDPEHGNVFDRTGALWSGCHYLRNTDVIRDARERIRSAPASIPHVAGETLVFSESVYRNYWHWHADCLPTLHQAKRLLPLDHVHLLPPPMTDWQRQGAEAVLGFAAPEAVGLVHVDAVYVSSYMDGRSIYPDAGVMGTFEAIKAAVAPPKADAAVLPDRIFVSRKDATDRVLENEDELAQALAPFGFVRVTLTQFEYAAKVALFAQARIVVGCHGAGLTNIGFCRPGASVIEIVAASRAIGAIRLLAVRAGLNHHWYSTNDEQAVVLDVEAFMADVHSLLER